MEKGGNGQGKRTRNAVMERAGSCRQNLESTVPVLGVTQLQLTRRLRHYSGAQAPSGSYKIWPGSRVDSARVKVSSAKDNHWLRLAQPHLCSCLIGWRNVCQERDDGRENPISTNFVPSLFSMAAALAGPALASIAYTRQLWHNRNQCDCLW